MNDQLKTNFINSEIRHISYTYTKPIDSPILALFIDKSNIRLIARSIDYNAKQLSGYIITTIASKLDKTRALI